MADDPPQQPPRAEPDLALVSTDDLIGELERRHDALVVARMRQHDGSGRAEVLQSYNGNFWTCLGLVDALQVRMRAEAKASAGADDDE